MYYRVCTHALWWCFQVDINCLSQQVGYQSMVSFGLWKWRAHLGPHLLIVKIIWEISLGPSLYSSEGSAYLKWYERLIELD